MSPSWGIELIVRIGPGGVASLPALPRGARITAVVSSHHARYALLPWSPHLTREDEWQALAAHRFAETYGAAARRWDIRVSPARKRTARVACAIDRGLLAELRSAAAAAGARVVSIQPGLMHAFNTHRRRFRSDAGWLVAADEGRVTLALIAAGAWELVRVRNVGVDWQEELAGILRREETLARREHSVDRAVIA